MIKEEIEKILDYVYEDEERHYSESDKPKDHIFNTIKRVKDWLASPSCPLTDEDELE